MLQTGSYNKPRIDIPDSEKKETYHTNWCRSILYGSFTDAYASNYLLMAELQKFYNFGSSGELTSFLQKAQDGSDLPAYWITTNTIKTKIDLLVGELEQRGYEIKVHGVNGDITSRKLEEKERLRVQRRLAPVRQQAAQISGMQLGSDEYVPQTEQELDEYMDLSFKDKAEIIMEAALKFIAEFQHWDEARKKLFMDVLITNRCIVRSDIVNGMPQSTRIEPLNFIFDPDSTNDMLSDSTYFGEVYYMPLATAAERYNLSEDELHEVYNSYETFLGMGQNMNPQTQTAAYEFAAMGTNRFRWFKRIDNSPRVLVVRAVWRDVKQVDHKHEINEKYGTEHLQEVTNVRKKDQNKVVSNRLECWRECTIIGGYVFREWGELPNQPRDLGRLEVTEPPYKCWIPNYMQSRAVSKVEQLVGLQLFKDILMYNMQVQVSTSGGAGFVYDLALKPENMTQEQVLAYLKTAKIAFINSKEYQLQQGNLNLFKDFDLSLGNSLNGTLQLMNYVDTQMDSISGVSPERQGIVQGASVSPGVTNAALLQNNLITAPYFNGFERFCSRVLNHQAKLVKVAWAGREVFAPIIGDTGIDFLKNNIDLELDEFAVFVKSLPPLMLDRQKLEEMVSMYVQSGGGSPEVLSDALAILIEPDTKSAIRRFQRKVALRKMLQDQQAQAQAQQDAQTQQQIQQLELQKQQMLNRTQLQLQEQKNQGNIEKAALTGRVKLNEKKLDLLKV